MLTGEWVYRSYLNNPVLVAGSADAALKLIFGEGVMTISQGASGYLSGRFDMGGGYVLNLVGSFLSNTGGGPQEFELSGTGVDGTPTAGWRYDYRGIENYSWPDGKGQVPTLVGTVIRTNPHGSAPAGFSASFICVRRG